MKYIKIVTGFILFFLPLWLAGYAFHLLPLTNDMEWWYLPWLMTVAGATVAGSAGGFYLFCSGMDMPGKSKKGPQ